MLSLRSVLGLPSVAGPLPPQRVRVVVRCDTCGHRMTAREMKRRGIQFHIVCHDCETLLVVEVPA